MQMSTTYIGFTLRKTGNFKTSLTYSTRRWSGPEYEAAREYLGELYVETDKMEKAKEQLAALQHSAQADARSARICKRRSTPNRPATDGKEKRAPARPLAFSRSRPVFAGPASFAPHSENDLPMRDDMVPFS